MIPVTPSTQRTFDVDDASGGLLTGRHVDYVLAAEFDIDRGSALSHEYPEPTGTKREALAELMLPDGAHLRTSDWTVFFLNQRQDAAASPASPDKPLLFVLNHVCTKHDASTRRGARMMAMAVASRHHFVHVFKPVLVLAMMEYLDNPDRAILAKVFAAINDMDLAAIPRLTRAERLIMRNADNNSSLLFARLLGTPEDVPAASGGAAGAGAVAGGPGGAAADFGNGPRRRSSLSNLAADARASTGSGSGALATPAAGAGARSNKDPSYHETHVLYDGKRILVRIPMTFITTTEEVMDFSMIALFNKFAHHAPFPAPHYPSLHAHGAATPAILLLLNAMLTHQRVLFVAHGMPAGEVANYVLAACALASGCGAVFRGFTERAFPYTCLANVDELLACPGYIAGVTNPFFEEKTHWWDVCCNVVTGKIRVSPNIKMDEPARSSSSSTSSTPNLAAASVRSYLPSFFSSDSKRKSQWAVTSGGTPLGASGMSSASTPAMASPLGTAPPLTATATTPPAPAPVTIQSASAATSASTFPSTENTSTAAASSSDENPQLARAVSAPHDLAPPPVLPTLRHVVGSITSDPALRTTSSPAESSPTESAEAISPELNPPPRNSSLTGPSTRPAASELGIAIPRAASPAAHSEVASALLRDPATLADFDAGVRWNSDGTLARRMRAKSTGEHGGGGARPAVPVPVPAQSLQQRRRSLSRGAVERAAAAAGGGGKPALGIDTTAAPPVPAVPAAAPASASVATPATSIAPPVTPSASPASPATSSTKWVKDKDNADFTFVDDVQSAIAGHFSELYIRSRVQAYLHRWVRLAAFYERVTHGRTALQPPTAPGTGTGPVWPSMDARARDLAVHAPVIEAWRARSPSYGTYVADLAAATAVGGAGGRPWGLDVPHLLDRLTVQTGLAGDDVEAVYDALLAYVASPAEVTQLLAYLPLSSGGLMPLAAPGVFHPSVTVRAKARRFVHRLMMHSVGDVYLRALNPFVRQQFYRGIHAGATGSPVQARSNSGAAANWETVARPSTAAGPGSTV
ncbi:hypothetical protein H9P43_007735 [Blastocladiella emersonii ATCC 22665]|nr:hypothetical protein H9P43_007735 [Blastocladiella emersonii ATCC 22665]